MFNKQNKIVIMLYGNVMLYPPAISLIECLLENEYNVFLVSEGTDQLSEKIRSNKLFQCYNVVTKPGNSVVHRISRRAELEKQYNKQLLDCVGDKDILWTINPIILRILRKNISSFANRHILQLYELMESDTLPLFKGSRVFKFSIGDIARNAWKNVVVEKNRAYIQKVLWDLNKVPYVIPNKPYNFDVGEQTSDMEKAIDILRQERRRIIMYLGVMDADRNFAPFANAIERVKDQYCLCMLGKVDQSQIEEFNSFCSKYESIHYLGFYNPPHHLYFLKYAYMALVPYAPGKTSNNTSPINALYCAPNKIWEYAGMGIPMIGTDVLGLKEPFEKYDIGVCCENLDTKTIIETIQSIESRYEVMSKNCRAFYDHVDLNQIINRIINE